MIFSPFIPSRGPLLRLLSRFLECMLLAELLARAAHLQRREMPPLMLDLPLRICMDLYWFVWSYSMVWNRRSRKKRARARVILLVRGSILEVTGYRNASPPTPTSVWYCWRCLCLFWENCVPGHFIGVVFVDSEKMAFLEMFDMYLIVFVIFSQYVVITLLIHQAIIAVTVTDSGDRK